MKAALVQSFDAPPIYTDFPAPIAAEGEQLITVTAAGLHQIVKGIAAGTHYMSSGKLPFIPGVDAAGRLADGTRVYFGGDGSGEIGVDGRGVEGLDEGGFHSFRVYLRWGR